MAPQETILNSCSDSVWISRRIEMSTVQRLPAESSYTGVAVRNICASVLLIGSLLVHLPLSCAEAQRLSVAATAGTVKYDFGGDQSYFTFGVQGRYAVSPILHVGLLGSTAHIGDPSRAFAAPGTDEQIWRAAGLVRLSTKPMPKLSIGVQGAIGLFVSSGLVYQGPPPDLEPIWQFSDAPTGLTYGGGLLVEIGAFSRLRGLLQGNIWVDKAYGTSGVDLELLFGIGVDL